MTRRLLALASVVAWAGGGAGVITLLNSSAILPGDDAVALAFEGLRRAALVGAWYVVVATLVGVFVRGCRAAALVRLADAVTVRPLRHALRTAVGAGLAASLTLSPAAAIAADPDEPPIVTLHKLPPEGASDAPAPTTPPTWATTTTTTVPPPTTTTTAPRWNASPPPLSSPRRAQGPAGHTWSVRPGDCFWSIAAATVSSSLGRHAAPREVAAYWRRLIAENRLRLADPANPDLLFPGQTLLLP